MISARMTKVRNNCLKEDNPAWKNKKSSIGISEIRQKTNFSVEF